MIPKIGKGTPPSRQNKKQIIAHGDPALIEAAHVKCHKEAVTIQELIALAVNAAVAEYGRSPFLKVVRDRLVRRTKAPAKVQENGPDCRNGKRRIAAWFDKNDHDQVSRFASEVGTSIEQLVLTGLPGILRKPIAQPTAVAQEERHREAA